MRPSHRQKRAARAAGALVLGAFALGFSSAPARSCLSHPDHAGGGHHGESPSGSHHETGGLHAGGAAPDPSSSTGGGCDCLGLCHVEHAPLLAGATLVGAPLDPAPAALLSPARASAPRFDFLYRVPLARPPPAKV